MIDSKINEIITGIYGYFFPSLGENIVYEEEIHEEEPKKQLTLKQILEKKPELILTREFSSFLEGEREFINASKDSMPEYTQRDLEYLREKKQNLEIVPEDKYAKQAIFNAINSVYEDCEIGENRIKHLEQNSASYKYLLKELQLPFHGAFIFGSSKSDMLNRVKKDYKFTIIVALFAVVGFVVLNLLLGPSVFASAFLVFGLVSTAGPVYGILNGMIATRRSPSYYMLGHIKGQRPFVESNEPNVLACTWGMIATCFLTFILAVILTGVSLFVPIATYVLPLLTLCLPFLIGFFELSAFLLLARPERFCDIRSELTIDSYIDRGREFFGDVYSSVKNKKHCNNGVVNLFGYLFLPLVAIGIFVAATQLPPLALGAVFSLWMPATVLLLSVVFLSICYKYVNDNNSYQVVNKRCKLDFSEYEKLLNRHNSPEGAKVGDPSHEWFFCKKDNDSCSYSPNT
ncbi:MAG: hypothetical protein HON55_00840 [Legionellales bacterium]|jgi:hypothetical protein|nr:hypothetical protein [Legionellales bacterium]